MAVKGKKKIFLYKLAVVIIPALIFWACNNSNTVSNNPPANNPSSAQRIGLIKLLVGNGNNLFRSVNLGEDLKTVLNSEKKIPDENDTDDISYTFPMDTVQPDSINEPIDSINYFKITYYLDKEKLNEIDEDIYLESDSSASNLLNRLTDYLSSKYGEFATRNDSRVWSVSRNGKKVWLSLSDQSEEYDNGKLLLVLYSEDI